MIAATATEFNPDYFKAIFGEDASDWREFIQVNLNTYRNGYSRLKNATEHKNLDEIKEVRHALGPTLQQWSAVTLEQGLMALTEANMDTHWRPLEAEFEALIAALDAL